MIRKLFFFITLLKLIFSFAYAQDTAKSELLPPSFNEGLGDTNSSTSEIIPVCLNLAKVTRNIRYPDAAKDKNIHGKVLIKILVGLDGDVIELGEISGPEVFYSEVRRVSMKLKFSIASVNGKAIKCWVTVPFNFALY
jgi:TonB family protein